MPIEKHAQMLWKACVLDVAFNYTSNAVKSGQIWAGTQPPTYPTPGELLEFSVLSAPLVQRKVGKGHGGGSDPPDLTPNQIRALINIKALI